MKSQLFKDYPLPEISNLENKILPQAIEFCKKYKNSDKSGQNIDAANLEETNNPSFHLEYLTAQELSIKPVRWLWYPYIPKGAVTLLSSAPGSGKTYLATWIAAKITSGKGFPLNNDFNDLGNGKVVYLSLEDSYNQTIIPRFIKNGGNINKIVIPALNSMPESFSDLRIEAILNDHNPALIIFDALSSFIGEGNINYFNDVRKALHSLLERIENRDTAILLIAHNNKMSSVTNAMDRVSGSVDFTAFVRSGLSIGKNPFDPDQIVMAQFKNNLYDLGQSLVFYFEYPDEVLNDVPELRFDSLIDISADELLGAKKKNSPVINRIKKRLFDLLKEHNGIAPAKQIREKLHKEGFKDTSITKAKKELGIKSKTIRKEKKNQTFWSLEEY